MPCGHANFANTGQLITSRRIKPIDQGSASERERVKERVAGFRELKLIRGVSSFRRGPLSLRGRLSRRLKVRYVMTASEGTPLDSVKPVYRTGWRLAEARVASTTVTRTRYRSCCFVFAAGERNTVVYSEPCRCFLENDRCFRGIPLAKATVSSRYKFDEGEATECPCLLTRSPIAFGSFG